MIIFTRKHVKRLISDYYQYTPTLLVWLTNLVLKRNDHVFVDSRCNDQGMLTKHVPFLDVAFAELKPRFIQEKNHIVSFVDSSLKL